ncbi:hypothetical protein D8Y22_05960 [Salinadaptatus halalkaliphilus]|uniref:Uncharacterized protein n=1 Tax=Salinadaptatus halalkaliphilus TaxID=2419781 RepID=A0A4S3TN79_9EURY|nr:hypothetical protein [Salinadaptatus halalkaliphilus]THE65711.1 hypothetical protein D8Y22_05960 [Salinadaptatus halalkaliphilus]
MSERDREAAAHMELTPDSWHQTDDGNYYIDCPECGSAATLMNVVDRGRCNGYLDQQEDETELEEEAMDCTAKLWLELGYTSDPGETPSDDAAGESEGAAETDEGVPASDQPPGNDGTVSEEQADGE